MTRKISALLGALLASMALVAIPSAPASAANCSFSGGEDWQRMSALCSSGSGVRYRVWVQCTNDSLYMGPARYYGNGVASVVECPGQTRIKNYGTQALFV